MQDTTVTKPYAMLCIIYHINAHLSYFFFLKRPNVYIPTHQICLSVALSSGLPAGTQCELLTLILFVFLVCA